MPDDPYKYFRIEAREIVDALTRGGLELERGGASGETIRHLLRVAHTLKGAARVVGLLEISDLAHAIEDALAPHREGAEAPARDQVEMIVTLINAIASSVAA
jgi:two-component system chemotaxis sensor kinase CheA